jgi:hypothetical protein
MGTDVFARITAASTKLNKLADDVSRRIKDAEARLESVGFRVEDSVGFRVEHDTHPFDDFEFDGDAKDYGLEEGADIGGLVHLVYRRVGDRWRICAQRSLNRFKEDYGSFVSHVEGRIKVLDTIPLLDCDRDTRIKAAKRLNGFLEVMASHLEQSIASVEGEQK